MRAIVIAGIAGLALAGCATEESTSYICTNGPDLIAVSSDTGVSLQFNDGRVEVVTPVAGRSGLYTNAAGVTWSVGGRDARLDMDRKSYLCDSLA